MLVGFCQLYDTARKYRVAMPFKKLALCESSPKHQARQGNRLWIAGKKSSYSLEFGAYSLHFTEVICRKASNLSRFILF
jgi:hypothetical protein